MAAAGYTFNAPATKGNTKGNMSGGRFVLEGRWAAQTAWSRVRQQVLHQQEQLPALVAELSRYRAHPEHRPSCALLPLVLQTRADAPLLRMRCDCGVHRVRFRTSPFLTASTREEALRLLHTLQTESRCQA